MDYIDAATSGTLSPHILPVMDLQKMLIHIEETLQPMLHLPVSSDNTLHYDIATKYLGITRDKTMAVELLSHKFEICQAANEQFCTIPTPFSH